MRRTCSFEHARACSARRARPGRGARRPGCCSRGRTTGATRAGCRGCGRPSPARRRAGPVSMRKRNCGFTSTRAQGHLDPRVEVPFRAGLSVQLHRLLEVRIGDRPPVGPAHQRGRGCAWHTLPLRSVPFGSQTKIRRRLGVSPCPSACIRPGDRDLVERRRDAGVPVHVVVGLVRLALGLQQRRGFFTNVTPSLCGPAVTRMRAFRCASAV